MKGGNHFGGIFWVIISQIGNLRGIKILLSGQAKTSGGHSPPGFFLTLIMIY